MWLGFSVDLTLGLSVVGTVLSVPITDVSIELSSRTVARKVFSPLQSLTSVFGMGTGGPSAFVTLTTQEIVRFISYSLNIEQHLPTSATESPSSILSLLFETTQSRRLADCTFSIERR